MAAFVKPPYVCRFLLLCKPTSGEERDSEKSCCRIHMVEVFFLWRGRFVVNEP